MLNEVKKTDEKLKKEFEGKDEKVLSIKKSDEKQVFWKPVKVGEKIEGKLVGIVAGGFGDVLKLKTKKGVVGVNVNQFLKDIDFTEYADEVLRFTFQGKVGKRGLLVFDVERVLAKDEVPF